MLRVASARLVVAIGMVCLTALIGVGGARADPTGTSTLTISRDGRGTGTVTSSPAGIDCGSTCTASFDNGQGVMLTADASPGSVFTGWSDCGNGPSQCGLSISAPTAVTATFMLVAPIRAALSRLVPTGKAARLAAITKADGYRFSFPAPSAGDLGIGWSVTAKGHKRTFIAANTTQGDGRLSLKVGLSPAGKRVLRAARRIKVRSHMVFTVAASETLISVTKTFTLKR